MRQMIETHFKFHPIGQGCLYSGQLQLGRKPSMQFNFIYDCGTDSKMEYLKKEVASFKRNLFNNSLDCLMISHFDADHVNGVAELLTNLHCKRVIIPYYNPIERLLLYVTTSNTDDDYRRFLSNPVDYLNDPDRFRVEEIIVIGGPDENASQEIGPDNNVPPVQRNFEDIVSKIEGFSSLPFNANTKYISDDETGKRILALENFITDTSKVKILQKPYKVDVGIWEFFFYLKKHDNLLLIKNFTRDVNDLINENSWSIIDLFDEENVEELKKLYRTYYGQNLNNTSLVTYHGPLFNVRDRAWGLFCDDWFWCECDKNCGSLLTGDVDLNSTRKIKKLLDYYGAYINEVCVFQVPHHGSVHNWCSKYPNQLESFCNYVINHGVGRTHHPSADVVHYLKTHCVNGDIHFNNENDLFSYGFHIVN